MRTGYECVMSVPADMDIVMVQALHECTQSPNPCGIREWDVLAKAWCGFGCDCANFRVVPWNKIKMMLALHANHDAKHSRTVHPSKAFKCCNWCTCRRCCLRRQIRSKNYVLAHLTNSFISADVCRALIILCFLTSNLDSAMCSLFMHDHYQQTFPCDCIDF